MCVKNYHRGTEDTEVHREELNLSHYPIVRSAADTDGRLPLIVALMLHCATNEEEFAKGLGVRSGAVHRFIAVFLLVFASSGVVSSEPCGEMEELLGCHLDGSRINQNAGFDEVQQFATTDSGQDDSDSTLIDDDCLFWCAHVLPGSAFATNFVGLKARAHDRKLLLLTTSPSPRYFRPPRVV